MAVIHMEQLSRRYEFYRKEPGFLGTLKSLFCRETLFVEAVKDMSFDVAEGELVGFLGPNGAGKTTTLKMLSGLLHPTSGQVSVLGCIPADRQESYQRQIALVMGQKNQLLNDLPAYESFILNKELYGMTDADFQANLDELTELLDIGDILDIPVRKLSLGQRMKCELVAALIHTPKILLLDEPTIGLDVVAQKNIRDFLKRYNREKRTTILLTSHYMEDIRELCERVILINRGQLVYDGCLDTLIKEYAPHKLLRVTLEDGRATREQLSSLGEIENVSLGSVTYRVPRDQAKDLAIRLLSSGLPIDDIMIDEVDIDDVVRIIFTQQERSTQ